MSPLVRLVTVAVLPISLLISISHLAGADQGPGDGFTAGVISSIGFTLQYVSFGYVKARHMLRRVPFQAVLITGLALAVTASLLPMFSGEPFLAIQEANVDVPWIGSIRLTRAMLFDVGVYLVVLGGAMTAIDSLGRSIS